MDVQLGHSLSLGSGPLYALDESLCLSACGKTLRLLDARSGEERLCAASGVELQGSGGFQALAVLPSQGLVAASVGGQVFLYQLPPRSSAEGGASAALAAAAGALCAPPAKVLSPYEDYLLTAMALSCDGSRLAVFGGPCEFGFSLWGVEDGGEIAGMAPRRLPSGTVITHAAFCPASRQLLLVSGPQGLFFIRLHASHSFTEAAVLPSALPPAPRAQQGEGGAPLPPHHAASLGAGQAAEAWDARIRALVQARSGCTPSAQGSALEAPADAARALLEAGLAPSSSSSAAPSPAPAEATPAAIAAGLEGMVIDYQGRNCWMASAWVGEEGALGANAAGQLCAFAVPRGAGGGQAASEGLVARAGEASLSPLPPRPTGAQLGAITRCVNVGDLVGDLVGGAPSAPLHITALAQVGGGRGRRPHWLSWLGCPRGTASRSPGQP